MAAVWRRLPVIVRALVLGALVAVAGTVPWAYLVSLNIRRWPAVPWAVPLTAIYLWLFWRYVTGAGWPPSTARARRELSRANTVQDDAWLTALLAGDLDLGAMLLLQGVMSRLVTLPQQKDIDPSQYPALTVFMWVVMSAIVAGVVEETAFRGYMQGPIERRHGPVVAILATGTVFGFVHFTHPEVGLALLPYYLAVAAVYGTLAHLTNSVYPSMLLHAGDNMLSSFSLFTRGRSEWSPSATHSQLIWETGPDAAFWLSVAGLVVASGAAIVAFAALARVTSARGQPRTQ